MSVNRSRTYKWKFIMQIVIFIQKNRKHGIIF